MNPNERRRAALALVPALAALSLMVVAAACSLVHDYDALGRGAPDGMDHDASIDSIDGGQSRDSSDSADSGNSGDTGEFTDSGNSGDAGDSGAKVVGHVACSATSCTTGADDTVCCADPLSKDAGTCSSKTSCTKVPVVCDDAEDCGNPQQGQRCCLWKQGSVINVACMTDATCRLQNSFAELCEPSKGCPGASERCITTLVIDGYFKCEPP